jgi:sulfate permease, SulP family
MASLSASGEASSVDKQIDHLLKTIQFQVPVAQTLQTSQADQASDFSAVLNPPGAQAHASERVKSGSDLSTWANVLDATLCSVPVGLVGVSLAYASLPAQYLSMGVLATLLALAMVHFCSAGTNRPMAYSARLFEATTLCAMLIALAKQLPGWGLAGTGAQMLAILCVLSSMAGVVCALLYWLGADRFTRLIPSPVYSGFAISISLLLLMSQSKVLYRLWQEGSPAMVLLSISACSVIVGLWVRKFKPQWPSTACSIAAGATLAGLWLLAGQNIKMLTTIEQAWMLPWQAADFATLAAAGEHRMPLAMSLLTNSILLGIMVFINMTVANEAVSQLDDRYASKWQQMGVALTTAFCGAAGSAPLASSMQASSAALRNGALTAKKSLGIGLMCLLIALSGIAQYVSLAAVAAAMLVDAYFMADRVALASAWHWLKGRQLSAQQKEDLYLIAMVVFVTVAFNVVSAVFVGLLFGLILFAKRNASKPVRHVWNGSQLNSNCARGRAELAVLAAQGHRIRVVELDGELFFGSVAALDVHLKESLNDAHSVILDWSRVRDVESSIAMSLARWQRMAQASQVRCMHAGASVQSARVSEFLQRHFPQALIYPDVDRALEAAESALIAGEGKKDSHLSTQLADALFIFRGLDTEQRNLIQSTLPQRLFKARDTIFSVGEASDHMLIVMQGSAGVIVQGVGGREIRVMSVRRGGVIGEIGFLDQSPRSANVIAQEDVLASVLTREAFENIKQQHPSIATQLLINLTIDLATRLRHTNQFALARSVA